MNDFIGGAGYNKPTEEQVKAKKMILKISFFKLIILLLLQLLLQLLLV